MQSEQAVQFLLKVSISIPPGGQTEDVFFSFTVESFFGLGAGLSCPLTVREIPNQNNKDAATILRRLSSVT